MTSITTVICQIFYNTTFFTSLFLIVICNGGNSVYFLGFVFPGLDHIQCLLIGISFGFHYVHHVMMNAGTWLPYLFKYMSDKIFTVHYKFPIVLLMPCELF